MKVLFAFFRLITAGLLFWALAKHSPNYYIVLRWVVFVVALWGAYSSYQQEFDKWFLVCLHVVLVVLFNPFSPLNFAKSTWNFIDVVAGLVIFGSTFILHENFLDTRVGRWVGIGLGVGFHTTVLLFGLAVIYTGINSGLQSLRLWFDSAVVKAQITRVTHDVVEVEFETSSGYQDVYRVDYSFNSNGKTFYGSSTLADDPVGTEGVPAQPTLLDVEYQQTNPNNNHAVASSRKLNGIFEALLTLAFGIAALVWSLSNFKFIFWSMKRNEPKAANDHSAVS